MSQMRAAPAAVATQCARAVLMVRPATFYANPETLASNAFQHVVATPAAATLAAAQLEFDRAADALAAAGVEVAVASADGAADTPDALFPNNWFSTHEDGRVVLYPMAVPSRRRERRPELLLLQPAMLASPARTAIGHSTTPPSSSEPVVREQRVGRVGSAVRACDRDLDTGRRQCIGRAVELELCGGERGRRRCRDDVLEGVARRSVSGFA